MRLGVMQPYFFPYLGYFELICRSDRWIVFDVVDYQPKSWMNRNRILHPQSGWQYVSVPVDRHVGQGTIAEVRLVDPLAARQRLLGQLQHYRSHGNAPFFGAVIELVQACFDGLEGARLVDLNTRSLSLVCEYLDLAFAPQRLSSLALPLPPIVHPGQWALEIAAALGASSYHNPPGGRAIFRPEEWRARGIELGFTELLSYRYACGPYEFVDQLSVLDAMMWNSPAQLRELLLTRAGSPLSTP